MSSPYNPLGSAHNLLGLWRPYEQTEGPTPAAATRPARNPHRREVNSVAGGRQMAGRVSVDRQEDLFGAAFTGMAQFSPSSDLRDYNLDPKALRRMTPSKLMELMADVSPDVSRALHDFITFFNPGWTATACRPGTDKQDPEAQKAVDAFLGNLHGPYAAPNVVPADVVINSIIIGGPLRGGLFAELVLDAAGRVPLEIATPDPATVRFKRVRDEARGLVWQLGQWQGFQFVPLDRPTVAYIPIHPLPGKPEGRPLFQPALFTTLFLIGLFHDLRRVIAQQGWPRLDITVDFELLKAAMPAEAQDDSEAFEEWVAKVIKSVEQHYGALEPDDAFIHGNAVKVNQPVGTVDSRSLGAVEGIIKALERQAIRALKTMPLLFGVNEATTETHANRQWEIHSKSVETIQHLCEDLLSRLLTLALRVQGIAAEVRFKFSQIRASERIRDAQAEGLEIANEARKRDEGWQTNDQASQKITGSKAVSQTPLRPAGGTPTAAEVPDGAQRARAA